MNLKTFVYNIIIDFAEEDNNDGFPFVYFINRPHKMNSTVLHEFSDNMTFYESKAEKETYFLSKDLNTTHACVMNSNEPTEMLVFSLAVEGNKIDTDCQESLITLLKNFCKNYGDHIVSTVEPENLDRRLLNRRIRSLNIVANDIDKYLAGDIM